MTTTRYNLLTELVISVGRVVAHDRLLQRVRGLTNQGDSKAIRTHLMRLRQKLVQDDENPRCIFTETREGYRMDEGAMTEPK